MHLTRATRETHEVDPLGELEPVSLDEVLGLADLQTRRDRKYLVPRSLVGYLVADAGLATRVLTIGGARSFRYESVYFDTVDLASYIGAARRRPRRFKVRTRTYLDAATCMLEVKTRDPWRRTVKHRHPYDLAHRTVLTDSGRRFVATIDDAAPVVDRLRPTLMTAYRRTTLVLDDARVDARVTIDVDLAWASFLPPPGPDGGGGGGDAGAARAHLSQLALVETKTSGRPCAFDQVLWRHGLRPVVISKYCTGLAAVAPHLPANKWNRVLRRHFGWLPATEAA